MFKALHSKKGFTLIELIITITIIGVLAAVAAPIMSANVSRAKRSEAVGAFGAVRTAERLYKGDTSSTAYGAFSDITTYIQLSDLNGRYYVGSDYGITTAGAGNVYINLTTYGIANMDFNSGTVNGG
ncbi:MAG: prepilin-type N-terminal cleavage/methylation domain-containing protein [Candidatus Omnitrophota bacterium]|nr:prepilin-type N-terminal cleavage/methylation domain-containing protein [Candidatus Omnitrophota bacterium]